MKNLYLHHYFVARFFVWLMYFSIHSLHKKPRASYWHK